MSTRTSVRRPDSRGLTVYETFTPASTAPITAVPRPGVTSQIASAIAVPGRQLFIYGQPGSGKSTALISELLAADAGEFVSVRCTNDTLVDSLVHAALDQYGVPDPGDDTLAVHLGAHALGSRGLTVVVEDAHRLAPEEREKLLTVMKVASDFGRGYPDLTIIVVAAVESPSEFGRFGIELGSRVAEIHVPHLSRTEIEQLVRRGGDELGADASVVAPLIAARCGGSAAIAHQLALLVFLEAGIEVPLESSIVVPPELLESAILSYLRAMPHTLRSRVDAAVAPSRYSREAKAVLSTLSSLDPTGTSIEEVSVLAAEHHHIGAHVFMPDVIEELTTDRRGAMLEQIGSHGVRFSHPSLHAYWSMVSAPLAS